MILRLKVRQTKSKVDLRKLLAFFIVISLLFSSHISKNMSHITRIKVILHLEDMFFFVSLRRISFHKHHEIDGHIRHFTVLIDLALVGNDSGRKYIVLRNFQKIIESTVFGVVLA